ncbi:MAG: DoxX family protein [Chitinophagales bacterium]
MKDKNTIIYWIATGLLSLMMLASGTMYFVNNPKIVAIFTQLGFPSYIIYPLAIAKILGIIAILTKKSKILKEWAYAGFFFEILLAFSAHIAINDKEYLGAVIAMILLMTSYFFDKKVFPQNQI